MNHADGFDRRDDTFEVKIYDEYPLFFFTFI